jgi:hypothetical protein
LTLVDAKIVIISIGVVSSIDLTVVVGTDKLVDCAARAGKTGIGVVDYTGGWDGVWR